jgi:zinc/manganese transport system substrate-binding protein
MWRRGASAVGLGLVLLTNSACAGDIGTGARDIDLPVVVATTTIVGDLASVVTGQEATVEVLMPTGADPRAYEPTPEQTRRLLEADLVVASGLGLEAGLAEALDDAERRGVPLLRLGESLYPLVEAGGTDGTCDPYWWMDPLRAAGAVGLIADALISVQDGQWVMRAMTADSRLGDLDRVIRLRLSRCDTWPRQLITSQPGLTYFAQRYDCIVSSPTAALAAGMDRSVDDSDEPVSVFVDSLGGPGSGAETYLDMMLTNTDRLAHAGSVVFVQPAPAGL